MTVMIIKYYKSDTLIIYYKSDNNQIDLFVYVVDINRINKINLVYMFIYNY